MLSAIMLKRANAERKKTEKLKPTSPSDTEN